MDKPADPATPFRQVYQHFLAVLKNHRKDVEQDRPFVSQEHEMPGVLADRFHELIAVRRWYVIEAIDAVSAPRP